MAGMYRVALPDGGLSDMFNLTWTKEHMRTGRFAGNRRKRQPDRYETSAARVDQAFGSPQT